MKKLTVIEYSKFFNISKQAVYQKIKKKVLEIEVIDGVKYILVQDDVLNNKNKQTQNDNQQIIDILNNQLEKKDKQIEELSLQLSQALKIQEETIEEKKQNNLLMAGLQKSLGLLDHKTETTKKKSFFRWFK